ncbi:23S rRNA (adenine(1618)-N(6))-methyltransferase RlmF [Sulfurimonas sp. MAG313]|nr:23S rRNA (adenine(1618)-N(6))-methyltransferase RlmF [Sulfurimonas sp. MAG313]MDF1881688.1 23S rRNA (adenine(1618)-N(6))-methyltransferase RlmF [Sulfurimonas sp. MAG313]
MKNKDKGLHQRNVHNDSYNFKELIKTLPELEAFVSLNAYKNLSIDFANAKAVFTLNKALLFHFYKLKYYAVPKGSLCPPIPGRADYLHYMADALAGDGDIPTGEKVKVLDIGTGANLIYPILGHSIYGWSFVGVDVEEASIISAQNIINKNKILEKSISCRLQKNTEDIFFGVFEKNEYFDFTLCNPPFHKSYKEASAGTMRKNKNLGKKDVKALNFEGQAHELWYPGGEISFITKMIKQSASRAKNCLWFSSLVSKKDNLDIIYKVLKQVKATDVRTINMQQGHKQTRIVSWTFLNKQAREKWAKKRSL